jgi:pimeloyl-ACP methyl ester carboxylesterase
MARLAAAQHRRAGLVTAGHPPDEQAFWADAGSNRLFGVMTLPSGAARGVGAVILAGGRYEQSAGRNRIARRLAHALAEEGFHVVRFDYHGVGDSTGAHEEFVLHEPFTDDLAAAASRLRRVGVSRLVLIGDCFGARTALAGAIERDDVAAMLLVSLPWRDLARSTRKADIQSSRLSVGDYAKRGLSWRVVRQLADPVARRAYSKLVVAKVRQLVRRMRDRLGGLDVPPWTSRRVIAQLSAARARRIPTLILYGRGPVEEYTADFDELAACAALAWIGAPGEPVQVETLDQPIAGYRNIVSQDEVVAVAKRWLPQVVGQAQEVA